jgi:pimeloyl-ACP methyl ester carboxylesterase
MTSRPTYQLSVPGVGPVDLSVTEYGSGPSVLLLHGGAGPQSMTGFAELLAAEGNRVIVPVHPGFGGTDRPDGLVGVAALAQLYLALLDELDVADVTVIGNSIGGWLTGEIATLHSPRVSRIVLIDPVGISVPGHPMADMSGLTMDQIMALVFHNPEPFTVDPASLPPAAQAIAAGNQAAMGAYAGATMADPGLLERLGTVDVPALVLWGESDGLVDADYGRAYAGAIPGARFILLPETGHSPQLETPDLVLRALRDDRASTH